MSKLSVSLRPIPDAEFLQEDGFSMCEAVIENGRIQIYEDLVDVLHAGGEKTILLIPRQSIDPCYRDVVVRESSNESVATTTSAFRRWHTVGAIHGRNAMPHTHDEHNCHAAVNPTSLPTGFFLRRAVIEAAEAVSRNRKHSLELREELENALCTIESANHDNSDAFFEHLHSIEPTTRGGNLELLHVIQDIQTRVHALGGMKEVSLDEGQYGMIGIPRLCAHGRSVREELMRDHPTAWRFFLMGNNHSNS